MASNKDRKDILICDCHSVDHQLVLIHSEDEHGGRIYPNCYAYVYLRRKNFWGRIKYGIKYIFGYQCNYGAFDEFIFNPEDAEKLQELVNHLKKTAYDELS